MPAAPPASGSAAELAREFYRQWDPVGATQPGVRDLEQAEVLLRQCGPDEAKALLDSLVRVTRKEWPECRSLSGAVQKYLGDALKLMQLRQQRQASRQQAEQAREQQRQEETSRQKSEQGMQLIWEALPAEQRAAIEQLVRGRLGKSAPEAFVRRLCLEELARRLG
jgi:hypothetical protein